MQKLLIVVGLTVLFWACGGKKAAQETQNTTSQNTTQDENKSDATDKEGASDEKKSNGNPSYDPNRGEGKFNDDNVKLSDKLDVGMATSGDKIQSVKCASCHKLTDERLVGPGWQGVTTRRKAAWLMNFITNPEPMIEKDPAVQAQLEICLVRMPNQNLNDQEAREVVEFMRKNDGVK